MVKLTSNEFAIDYVAFPKRHGRGFTRLSDDLNETEGHLKQLLSVHARITAIRQNGVPVTGDSFDHMLKVAAEGIASELLSESLAIDAAEIKTRFGFVLV